MRSGGDSVLRLKTQIMLNAGRQDFADSVIIISRSVDEARRLGLDHYVNDQNSENNSKFVLRLGSAFFNFFAKLFRAEETNNPFQILENSREYYPLNTNNGSVLYIKAEKTGIITVAGRIQDIASFTSLVLDDWRMRQGIILRRINGADHMSGVPFGTDKYSAVALYDPQIDSHTVTIVQKTFDDFEETRFLPLGGENGIALLTNFHKTVRIFTSQLEREIEETVYPLEDSFVFYTLNRLFAEAEGINISTIKRLFKTRPDAEVLKKFPQIISMCVGIKVGKDNRARSFYLRFHQKDSASGSFANESIWIGRLCDQKKNTILWDIRNSNPAYNVSENDHSFNALISIIKSIFVDGVRHICISHAVFDEIFAKKEDNNSTFLNSSGRTRSYSKNDNREGGKGILGDSFSHRIICAGLGVFNTVYVPMNISIFGGGFGVQMARLQPTVF